MSDAATRAFYGRWARLYDLLATAPGVAAWRERAVGALALDPGDTVVEMGCGTGANLPHLRDAVGPSGTVVGLDVTPAVLARARERVRRRGWENVALARADATGPPLDGPVDAVLATFVVGLFDDPPAAVGEWCRLASGGRVALLNLQASDRALAAPLNLAFDGLVWLASPGVAWPEERPGARHGERVRSAREALTDRTVERSFREFAGGYVGLLAGRVA
ncbi:MAG: class I SAM-dependent methyltransferase [Halorientalis sp.]